jgi:hypothetical protein
LDYGVRLRPADPNAPRLPLIRSSAWLMSAGAMHPPSAVGLEHGRVVRITCHVQDVLDDLLVVPAGREFRLHGPACPVPVPATLAVPVKDVPGAFGCDVQ